MVKFQAERQEIADTCRYLADHGYLAGTGGNIGVRVNENLMAVTPSATDYYLIEARDIVLLNIETFEIVDGDKVPTIEKGLHSLMLRKHFGRLASVHTHQPIASAIALLHETLSWPAGSDLQMLGPHVGIVPYRPSGTGMLAKAFAKALKPGIFAYLMASHGVICAGANLPDAVAMIRKIEATAAKSLRERISNRANLTTELRAFLLETLEKAELKGA